MGTATAGRVALANDEIETKFFTSSLSPTQINSHKLRWTVAAAICWYLFEFIG